MFLKVQFSYAHSRQDALFGAFDQWRANIFDSSVQTRLAGPDEFETAAAFVSPDDLEPFVRISAELDEHIEWIPAERPLHLRFNSLEDPDPIPRDTDYACVIESDLPVVVQHTRLDSRQAENALMTTIAFPAE